MTKRVFSAGFAWSVIEAKWPGFEESFLGFEPSRLAFEPDEFWHQLTMDARIVRNGAKIMSVRENARFVLDIAKEHGSFGNFLADWPPSDEVGLLEVLAKRGSRLGGNSGQMLLRFLGYDAFVATKDVAVCLRDAGLDIAATPTSKRDLTKIQEQFNAWAKETGLPYPPSLAHLRHVDRRELRGRPLWPRHHWRRSRVSERRCCSCGACSGNLNQLRTAGPQQSQAWRSQHAARRPKSGRRRSRPARRRPKLGMRQLPPSYEAQNCRRSPAVW